MKYTVQLMFFTMMLLAIFIAARAYEEAQEARHIACVAFYEQTSLVYPDCVLGYERGD